MQKWEFCVIHFSSNETEDVTSVAIIGTLTIFNSSGQHNRTTLGKDMCPFPFEATDHLKWAHVGEKQDSVYEAIEEQIAMLGSEGWEMMDFEALTPEG